MRWRSCVSTCHLWLSMFFLGVQLKTTNKKHPMNMEMDSVRFNNAQAYKCVVTMFFLTDHIMSVEASFFFFFIPGYYDINSLVSTDLYTKIKTVLCLKQFRLLKSHGTKEDTKFQSHMSFYLVYQNIKMTHKSHYQA